MADRALVTAAWGYLAANLVHTADHLRQGLDGVTTEVLVGGTALTLLAVVVVVLAVRDHPRAPLLAAVAGLSGAAGIAASHIAPHWSALSDSYPQIHADALSWVVMLIEIGAALWLGLSGLRALRTPAPTPRPG
jgi:hypothetical protein